MATAPSSDYAFVSDMFRRLRTLEEGSPAYRRQRDEIIEQCLPLASHIARRFRNRGEPLDDLVQAARVGLLNAVNRFDVDNGVDFLGFAVPTIMGEVRRHFRDHGWAVKVPRRMKELQTELNRARGELFQQFGRAPTATELAKHLEIDRETVIQSMIAGSNYSTLSTDMPAGADDSHQTVGERFGDVDPNLDKVIDVETVRPLIASLPERERTVLQLRFFANLTQSQIADQIGCSQMHISRLITKALGTLRKQIEDSQKQAEGRTLAATA
jgi:RNA polymerase sigma-B factor